MTITVSRSARTVCSYKRLAERMGQNGGAIQRIFDLCYQRRFMHDATLGLKKRIDQHLQKRGTAGSLCTVVQSLGTPEQVRRILEAILNSPPALERIAARSYTHKNGFDKIILLCSAEPAYKLRLHIWWPGQLPLAEEHIHNHSWNFSSVLLSGAYRFQLYQSAARGEALHQYLCAFPKAGIGYQMTYQGRAHLHCIYDASMQSGSVYSLSSQTLHRVQAVSNQMTSTLMLHGKFIRKTSVLFSKARLNKEVYEQAIPFTVADLTQKMEQYLSSLS